MSSEDVALNRHQDTSNGLRAVRQIAKRLNLDGVFGPLYDLFEVSDKYKTAVEVTSGNRLVFFFLFLGELTPEPNHINLCLSACSTLLWIMMRLPASYLTL